ncbi:helix-turn-helix domain-containing protein [Kiloniella majae]|uniref:helix-turn-helix domain-containing protein n=1 Tax=Kiloniella majae TaxID=1938558 RepID=UPI000A277B30|nr:AraC family transcriptional regulator [Kiloniella majae]
MLFIPLSFVVALLLLVFLAQGILSGGALQKSRLFQILIILYAVLSVLIGIRWGYGVLAFLPLQSILAASWASLAWLSFRSFVREGGSISFSKDWYHLSPTVLVVALVEVWPDPIDIALIATYLFYGLALLRLALSGPDRLNAVRLSEAPRTHLALWVTAIILIAFAGVDIFISYDFRFMDGELSGMVVSLANVPALLILGIAASVIGQTVTEQGSELEDINSEHNMEPEDREVLARIEKLIEEKSIYQDCDLSLDRLARKSGITSRRISGAINRLKGQNVSQFVNEYRVAEVCRRLVETDETITSIMFEAGFQTKSNFNREFKRVTGQSPKDWRQEYPDVRYRP